MSNIFNKNYRKSFLKGKKPKKKEYIMDYPYSGKIFDELMYDIDMDSYKNNK